MAVTIDRVEENSIAARLGITAGDLLLTISGKPVNDQLDYGFYTTERELTLTVETKAGEARQFKVKKKAYEELGISFDSFLMDGEHRCRNNCIFCFIDQLPKGMRETLYLKDDDERLSYLFGNYITLTNLSAREVQRIIDMRISPIHISVHTLDPTLRVMMMGNRFAGEALSSLYKLAEAGIEIHCQIVACKGINDGQVLRETLEGLFALWPAVRSVAVVPVGLTDHREGLYPLTAFDEEDAKRVLDLVTAMHEANRAQIGCGFCYPADEWYLLAGRELPPLSFYDELLQLENGVGMLALFEDEFLFALCEEQGEQNHPWGDRACPVVDLVTGEAASACIKRLCEMTKDAGFPITARVHTVKNRFFGPRITVSGLLTAKDVTEQVKLSVDAEKLLIPRNMLRNEGDLFLDEVSLSELSVYYGKTIQTISDGNTLFRTLIGKEEDAERAGNG